jgi:prevent-host-death family protein
MTQTIGVRELRQGLSEALRRVRAGETLEVTHRGRPVARIVPVGNPSPRLADLVEQGLVEPRRGSGVLPPPLDVPSFMTTEEAIDLLRGE